MPYSHRVTTITVVIRSQIIITLLTLNALQLSYRTTIDYISGYCSIVTSSHLEYKCNLLHKPPRPSTMQPPFQNNPGHRPNEMFYNNNPRLPPKPLYHCNNCGKDGHSASWCFAPGGGLAARPIWGNNGTPHNSNMNMHTSTPKPPFIPNNPPISPPEKQFPAIIAQPTDNKGNDMVMIASLTDAPGIKVKYNDPTTVPLINRGVHTWLIDLATTSHLSSDISLFHTIEWINPVIIETASGDSFTANQRGTIRIVITC